MFSYFLFFSSSFFLGLKLRTKVNDQQTSQQQEQTMVSQRFFRFDEIYQENNKKLKQTNAHV